MVDKSSKATNEKEKNAKFLGNQFWTQSKKSVNYNSGDQQIRPESTVSRQFLPKKQQRINEAWNKQAQEKVCGFTNILLKALADVYICFISIDMIKIKLKYIYN